MSVAELDATEAKLQSSQTHLFQARAKYKHMLDIDSDNDQVKLLNRGEIEQMIVKIDDLISIISKDIQNVEAVKKARLAEEN